MSEATVEKAQTAPVETARRQLVRRPAMRMRLAAKLQSVRDGIVDIDPVMRGVMLLGLVLLLVAVFAPWVAPYDPDAQKLLARLRPPLPFDRADPAFLLGTDQLGRDLLSRCIIGMRNTLALAAFGALIGLVIGAVIGLTSGLIGGVVDNLLMGLVDIQIAVPFTLVALLVIAIFGTDISVLVLVLGVAYWEQYARLTRAQVLSIRELTYVEAARAAGASTWRIATKHVAPNVASPVIVMLTLNISNLILLESSLSFLGLGVQPPTATLGSMVGQGRDYMASAPWIVAAPATAIVLIALVVMLVGDWLRDRFDVKLRERA